MEKPHRPCPGTNEFHISYPAKDINVGIFYPAADLRFFIKYYWMVQVNDTTKFNMMSQISPSGYPELMFHFGDNISVSTLDGKSPQSCTDTIIAGQITKPVCLNFNNHINCLCVKLQPYALSALFKIKCSEFTNRATNLSDVNPGMQKNIYDRLSEANSDRIRVNIIENYLRKLFKKNNNSVDSVTCTAINHLKASMNRNVGGLEQIMNISCRTIQRRIMEDVGISPKILNRIICFNKAYYLIKHNRQNRDFNLQDVSFCLGYYDLPHMINEFKEFTGSSPANYFKKEDMYNSFFAGIL